VADLEDIARAEDPRRRFGKRYHDAVRNIGFTAFGGSNFKEIIMAARKSRLDTEPSW
jgi:hypothetical protein